MTTPPDRDLLTLLSPGGKSSALIDLHGGQVLSWICNGIEQLFLSPAATFVPGQAVRGGIPVIFPQFGTFGPGQRHGFARLRTWERQPTGQRNVFTLTLSDDPDTRALWPYPFRVAVSVALPEEPVLRIGLQVTNPGPASFQFTCALHTYLGIGDIGWVRLCGLEGARFLDSTCGGQNDVQRTDVLRFDGEIDRIYRDAPADLVLNDGERRLRIHQTGFRDTVVWNPGQAQAARMADLGPGGHRHFVCVEAACVQPPIVLAPGATWHGSQTLIR
jgi:glucose-6-phosphate 1-epimerase